MACRRCGTKRTNNSICRDCLYIRERRYKVSDLELTNGYWYNDHGIQRWRSSTPIG